MTLERILAAKRRRLAVTPPLRPAVLRQGPGLAAVLARPGPAFILECKAASPSAGRLIADYDPAALAEEYADVADAVSVLTEPEFFGGDLAHLARVSELVHIPVLRKDFILAPEEIVAARAFGADAVLLMLAVLDDAAWRACFEACRELGMDALTEVHNEAELARALALGASIIGINNRDLETLAVDLAVTERLAPRIPPDRFVVSESGITGRNDVKRLAPRVDGFLVGSCLSSSSRPGRAARELVLGRLKVCGLTRPEDAAAAWRAGAVMGGLIFAPDSPRRVDETAAQRLRAAAPLDWVGVFRDQPVGEVASRARALELCAVQLHGAENAAYVRELRDQLPPDCAVWKAVPACVPLPAAAEWSVDRLLLDTGHDGVLGGSGLSLDPAALAGADLSRCILAGGIAPANVAAAARLGPWALDVNSGVESSSGVKDAARLRALADAVRAVPGKRNHTDEI